ncbi:unnamed protein product [Schistocephalus solidus]|uniref:C2H2-type domain-containing protein n=1 Tax=Schistocephalus solidus TaxID=70667 RepID=A0A183TST8_SCHSO|nr:unnamed protein product [Schistocephalus solidus]
MAQFGHMRIHDSGIHRNADNTDTSCTPSAPAILTANVTPNTMNDIPPASNDFSCPHCARIFNSRIGLLSSRLQSEPHVGDNEVVICPTIGNADRLGHQHVLSISPPDENIVQQMPAPRPRVHPRDLLPRQKAEEGVGQQETVFHTRAQQKDAVIVTATETVGT